LFGESHTGIVGITIESASDASYKYLIIIFVVKLSLLCVHGWEKLEDLFATSKDVQKRKVALVCLNALNNNGLPLTARMRGNFEL